MDIIVKQGMEKQNESLWTKKKMTSIITKKNSDIVLKYEVLKAVPVPPTDQYTPAWTRKISGKNCVALLPLLVDDHCNKHNKSFHV